MSILGTLIPISLFLGGLGLAAFIWALRTGQFDDTEGDQYRTLFHDEGPLEEREKAARNGGQAQS